MDAQTFRAAALAGIDNYCLSYNDGHRKHLGASLIGHSCNRYLWYVFRHVQKPVHGGRLLRLFNRGHREEARFTEWLRGSGWLVDEVDPETGKQFRFSAVNGHFGCSIDGIGTPPDSLRKFLPEGTTKLLLEYKTSGTGAKFNNTRTNGVKLEKPQHFSQMCIGGFGFNLPLAWYMMINKNDDDIEGQLSKLDPSHAEELIAKAEYVITCPQAPKRISETSTHFLCKMCDFKNICHAGELPEKNCRSCMFATAVVDNPELEGRFYCQRWQDVIPPEWIATGCEKGWIPLSD